MKGKVYRSINNIYSVLGDDNVMYSCRIKGKQLAMAIGEYNPIVVGDVVVFNVTGTEEGMITSREERKSQFQRWNVKSQSNQTICANMDIVVCVCSVQSPPFRPRFVDRVIACCRNTPVLVCLNKNDIMLTDEEFERLKLYKTLGFDVVSVSALEKDNIDRLKAKLKGKTCAFVGQSGVGKSSLVNLLTGSDQRVGEISEKYNRGCHTTNHAIMIDTENFTIIDTPGFREISVPHDDEMLVQQAFPEFADCKCEFDSCLHVNEKGCAVVKAVEDGKIFEDRYESYLRILDSLHDRLPVWSRHVQKNSK